MTTPMLLNGEWVDRDEVTEVLNPEDGSRVGTVPLSEVSDVDFAVSGAEKALASPMPAHERARILDDGADRLEARSEEAARLIATEGIKTIREARSEVRRAVATIRLSGEEAKRATGRSLSMDQYPSGEGFMGFTVREPLGIIGAITPFNDPLNLVAHKVGPALATGNSVILKPDHNTPLSALLLAECLHDSGLPPGRLNVVTGRGRVIGDAIVVHPAVKMVSFTGGVDAGRTIRNRAGLKRVVMELGANNAVIVHRDADLALATERIGSGAFWAAGQNCLHVQRVYAHAEVFDEFTDRMAKYAESVRLGPKLDEDTDMGPLIDSGALSRTADVVKTAVEAGAEVISGGDIAGASFEPTLLTKIAAGSPIMRDEIYAPVTVLTPYEDLHAAIDLANDTDYELASAIFTRDIDVAFEAAARLETGQVMINESTDFRIDAMPFGGGGLSGIGREGVAYAAEEMTELKVIAFSGVRIPGLG